MAKYNHSKIINEHLKDHFKDAPDTTVSKILTEKHENEDTKTIIQEKLTEKHQGDSFEISEKVLGKSKNLDGKKYIKDETHDLNPINVLSEIADINSDVYDNFNDTVNEGSQLHNSYARFKDLSKKDIQNNKEVKKMIMASVRDADAMLLHIYKVAYEESRELNSEEKNIVNGINLDKTKLLELVL